VRCAGDSEGSPGGESIEAQRTTPAVLATSFRVPHEASISTRVAHSGRHVSWFAYIRNIPCGLMSIALAHPARQRTKLR
jgi:hypothetical protein